MLCQIPGIRAPQTLNTDQPDFDRYQKIAPETVKPLRQDTGGFQIVFERNLEVTATIQRSLLFPFLGFDEKNVGVKRVLKVEQIKYGDQNSFRVKFYEPGSPATNLPWKRTTVDLVKVGKSNAEIRDVRVGYINDDKRLDVAVTLSDGGVFVYYGDCAEYEAL